MRIFACLTLSCFFIASSLARAETDNWPNWRGPALDGSSAARNLPTKWSDSENIVWKTEMPAWAGSSPVIWGDRIFVTSASERSSEPEEGEIGRRLRSIPVNVAEPGGRDILLLCISKTDGKLLWKKNLSGGNKFYAKHNMASPSPVTDGKRVYAVTGTGKVAAFDFEGKPAWKYDLQKEHGEFALYWGYASSPLLFGDKLITEVLHGSTKKVPSYLIAFNKDTGKVEWRVERSTDAGAECPDAYTTPTVCQEKNGPAIIVSGGDYVTAHDPKTGKELWRAGGLNPDKQKNYRICGSPIAANGKVIATSRETPIIAIKCDGKGDVTENNTLWTYTGKKGPDVPSAAYDGDRLYLIHDKGFATCLDAKTGEPIWGPERIASGPYSASPLVADGKVYITNEDAHTTILDAGPEFKVLHENSLDGGYTLSSFAVSSNRLYLRTAKYLYCIGESAKSASR